MARIFSSGFELNSTTSGVEWTSVTGAAISAVVKRSGTYALKIGSLSSGIAKYVQQQFQSSNADGPFYVRTYFRYITLPSADNAIIRLKGTGPSNVIEIRLSSTGTLKLMNNSSQVGSASSALSSNTWYRIELLVDATPAGGSEIARAYIDGTEFASSTALTFAATFANLELGGNLRSEAQTQGRWYFDDVALNDSTGSFQNSLPGAGSIVHLRPNASGDNNQLGTAASTNWQQVDEVTPDDSTTTISTIADSSGEIDDYNINSTPSDILTNTAITLVHVGVRYNGTSTSSHDTIVVRCKASSGGTVEESSGITPSNTTYVTNANAVPRTYPLTLYDLPGASTTAWTKADLDTTQIGFRKNADSTNGVRVSALWLLVEYVAPSVTRTLIEDFEAGLGSTSNLTRDTTQGANGSTDSAYATNASNGDVEPNFGSVTGGAAGGYLEFFVKLPASGELGGGDASAVIFDQGGWRWTSLSGWAEGDITDWQLVQIPLSQFTGDGNSTPTTTGTGTAYNPANSATLKFRFWNLTSRNWYLDEFYFVTPTDSSDVTVNAGVQTVTSSQPSPTVTAVRNVTINADVLALTVDQPSIAVSVGDGYTANAESLTLSLPSPTVTAIQNVSVSASAQSVTSSQPAPTVTGIRNVSVNASSQTVTV
jgi:hypothetical protein